MTEGKVCVDARKNSMAGRERREALARGVCALLLVVAFAACFFALPGCSDQIGAAQTLERQGDFEGALAAYAEVLKADPDNTRALSGSAVCLLVLKRYSEALALQERLVRLDPNDVQTRTELGFNYLNHQGRPADAVRVFEEAVKLDASAKNLCFLAQALEVEGDTQAAEQSLRQAINADPEYAYSYRLLTDLLQSLGRVDEANEVMQRAMSLGVDTTKAS
jgi:protein O-GlcNAc transferase